MNTNLSTASVGGAVGALKNLKAGLQNVRDNTKPKGGEPILRLGRDGKWIFGADNLEVEAGSTWAVNPLSLQHGFICWKVIPEGSKESPELLGEEMVSMFSTKPDKAALPDYGHPWADCLSFNLLCLDGEDKGEQTLYKTSSTGGLRASREFIAVLMDQLDKDESKPVPVVNLVSDHYAHKQYGKTYFPVFKVVKFVPMDEAPSEGEPAKAEAPKEEPQVETQPAGQRRRAAAPAPAPEPEVEDEQGEPETAQQQAAPAGEVRRRRRG